LPAAAPAVALAVATVVSATLAFVAENFAGVASAATAD